MLKAFSTNVQKILTDGVTRFEPNCQIHSSPISFEKYGVAKPELSSKKQFPLLTLSRVVFVHYGCR